MNEGGSEEEEKSSLECSDGVVVGSSQSYIIY